MQIPGCGNAFGDTVSETGRGFGEAEDDGVARRIRTDLGDDRGAQIVGGATDNGGRGRDVLAQHGRDQQMSTASVVAQAE